MTGSFVVCQACGDSSSAVEWGFVLLARHGWTAQLGDLGAEPLWRCPACKAREAELPDLGPIDAPEASNRRLRVLLVDDQILVLRATAGMLRELDVVTACHAAEALERLAEGGLFDAMVSDVTMPGMNGVELYVHVLERYPHLATSFLLLSGDSYGASLLCSTVARREGLTSMPKVLEKPVPRDVLVREIEEISRKHLPSSGTFAIAPSRKQVAAKTK